jgi:molybdopterin molybdotransferase
MDGYAVRAADVAVASAAEPARLRVRGAVLAGAPFDGAVGVGEAVAIVTGGVLPDGADAVVMVEQTRPDATTEPGGVVLVQKPVALGANLVRAGEDLVAGAEVLPAGRRLRASDLAALATLGVVRVPVFRRPRIAVFATGSELCPPAETPRRGQVRDSNSYVLAAEVEQAGCTAIRAAIVDDDLDRLRAAVARLVADHDGVILSGGSSIGPKDLTGEILRGLDPPGVRFHGIDIRPGKPTVFARAGEKPVVGMPG